VCGCCRICARESVDNSDVAILGPNGAGDLGGMVRLDVIFGGPGRHSARFQDHLQRRLDERKQRLQRGGKVYVGKKGSAKNAAKFAAANSKARTSKAEPPVLAAGLVASLMAGVCMALKKADFAKKRFSEIKKNLPDIILHC
jgi:hypothetical protein